MLLSALGHRTVQLTTHHQLDTREGELTVAERNRRRLHTGRLLLVVEWVGVVHLLAALLAVQNLLGEVLVDDRRLERELLRSVDRIGVLRHSGRLVRGLADGEVVELTSGGGEVVVNEELARVMDVLAVVEAVAAGLGLGLGLGLYGRWRGCRSGEWALQHTCESSRLSKKIWPPIFWTTMSHGYTERLDAMRCARIASVAYTRVMPSSASPASTTICSMMGSSVVETGVREAGAMGERCGGARWQGVRALERLGIERWECGCGMSGVLGWDRLCNVPACWGAGVRVRVVGA